MRKVLLFTLLATFAFTLPTWAARYEQLVIYQAAHHEPADPIYHPMLVGREFFRKTGVVM
jgi:hypothetical protein